MFLDYYTAKCGRNSNNNCGIMTNMKKNAIVFDFDGPLVNSGWDKSIHILFSSFVACWDTGFRKFLHPDNLEIDINKMIQGSVKYPGAPRFQQLSAVVSCIIRNKPESVKEPYELGVDENLQKEYKKLQERYNEFYSGLNDAAARLFWKPLPPVRKVIETLSKDYDLYVASGIIQEILERDFDHYGFDRKLFLGIKGSDPAGAIDKAEILKQIKNSCYEDVLFIGDSSKDLEYARKAGVKFFRIKTADDYERLMNQIKNGLPDEQDIWEYTEQELEIIKSKVLFLMKTYASEKKLSYQDITRWINTGRFSP